MKNSGVDVRCCSLTFVDVRCGQSLRENLERMSCYPTGTVLYLDNFGIERPFANPANRFRSGAVRLLSMTKLYKPGAIEAMAMAREKFPISSERNGTPRASYKCWSHSVLRRATSRLQGHSDLQPLQERHKSITAAISSESNGLALGERVRTSRNILARALVVSRSSWVAM
jgi:hypothetical protein